MMTKTPPGARPEAKVKREVEGDEEGLMPLPCRGRRTSLPLVLPGCLSLGGKTDNATSNSIHQQRADSSPALTPSSSADGGGGGGRSEGGGSGSCRSATDSTWSALSARGMTPSSLAPLGTMLDWADGGGGAAGGGGGGVLGGASNMSMSASLAGFAGYKSALLEARRAEVAEEQGEFWQGRAQAAETAKGRLEKVGCDS